MSRPPLALALLGASLLSLATVGRAGNVFVTGHDPDFHAADGASASRLLEVALDYVTCGTTFTTSEKFLVISARPADLGGVPAGHRDPIVAGFGSLGLVEGLHFDVANAAAIPSADFSSYTALAVVSSFGGLLTRRELDALNARSADIVAFLEDGGGVFASSECDAALGIACGAQLLSPSPAPMFGFLPFPLVSVVSNAPFTVTPFGAELGLVDADVNDATHNSFLDSAGLSVIDADASGAPTTLAGRWTSSAVFPVFDTAQARDPSDCSTGLLVSWVEALWEDPLLGGVYHVYRSEGPAASCEEALSLAPVATGLTELAWFDRDTFPGESYVYVVEAEDAAPPHGCDDAGPTGGGIARACTEPAVIDEALYSEPEGVFTTLFAWHWGGWLGFEWAGARDLLPGESYRLFKSPGTALGPFALVNGTAAVLKSHSELDGGEPLQFFELRVANPCDLLSRDEYPASR